MNIAILGAGNIARTMAITLQPLKDVTCYAVASRDIKKAQVFADKYAFKKAYGSYTDMLEDPEVELVYIATPHSHHYEHIKMCLRHNKHVLCEKAFTTNARQAEEVIRMAEEKGLLLTEAIWTRYMPMRQRINNIVNSGIIGKPMSLSANLGYPITHNERLTSPKLSGGALLDLGVYVLNFASMVFGDEITSMTANCVRYETGVDSQETIMLTYADGKMASLYVTMLSQTDRRGFIHGSNGYIEIENINNYESVKVYNLERKVIAEYVAPLQVTGYEYEVQSAINAIKNHEIECPEMPHYETIFIMQLMDSIRAAWGIKYPYEVERIDSDPEEDPDMPAIREADERLKEDEAKKRAILEAQRRLDGERNIKEAEEKAAEVLKRQEEIDARKKAESESPQAEEDKDSKDEE